MDLRNFIEASPSSFHAAREAGRRLGEAGFTQLAETDAWPVHGKFYLIRDGAVMAWIVPEGATATTSFNILGAHTDSPSFKLKPKPTTGRGGLRRPADQLVAGP